jgi:hypothetical protein
MLVATASAVAIATTFLTPPASAAEWDVVASGLDNPRQLSFRGNSLYVAEAGKGGGGPCIEGPEGDSCLGLSGAITRVKNGNQSRVLTGLPSLAARDGSGAIGPSDVVVVRTNRYTVSIGLGNDPAVKEDLGWRGRRLATIIRGTFGQKGPRVVANNDPDGLGPDTNPVSILKRGSRLNVVDAGGNALLRVAGKQIRVLTTFDSPGNAPKEMGGFPIQPVPTSVALGPDDAFYISELTGFPFLPGIARIHRWVPGMPTTVYATGLTNVTDLAWHGDQLYAVQITDEGFDAGFSGSLVAVNPGGSHATVAGDLFAPYGVAFKGDSAYVTTCAVCPGGGQVVRVPVS